MSQTYFVLQLLGGIAFLIGTTAFLYAMSQDRRGGKLHRISAAIAAGGLTLGIYASVLSWWFLTRAPQPLTKEDCKTAGMTWIDQSNVCG